MKLPGFRKLVNFGRQENMLRSESDSERMDWSATIIQKREALTRVRCEMAQLAEKEEQIDEDLRIALASCNRNVVPNEILHRIFILMAQEHGPVHFPILSKHVPPQLAISHVCSFWRGAALQTAELWNNAHIEIPYSGLSEDLSYTDTIRIHQLWLLRSRNLPVTLSIAWTSSNTHRIGCNLQKIIRPFHVKKLCLKLDSKQFLSLSPFQENILSEIELDISFSNHYPNASGPSYLIPQLRSLILHEDYAKDWLETVQLSGPSVPWSQLRRLEFQQFINSICPIFDLLRQMPVLQQLYLTVRSTQISDFGVLQDNKLIMHSLRDLNLELRTEIEASDDLNKILRGFMCPSLTDFRLCTTACWTEDTIDILRQQYNIQRLENADFSGFASPVSSMLQEAPMLRSLSLGGDAIMDDDAFSGISNGTLGRFLKTLSVYAGTFIGDMISMVEARKKLVDKLFESGYSWREEISILRHVTMLRAKSRKEYEERVDMLQRAGITIEFSK